MVKRFHNVYYAASWHASRLGSLVQVFFHFTFDDVIVQRAFQRIPGEADGMRRWGVRDGRHDQLQR